MIVNFKNSLFLFGTLAAMPTLAREFKIDADHSSVSFTVRHLLIEKVSGDFKKFAGEFGFDEKTKQLTDATANIELASVDTRSEKRDTHLKTKDFFDVEHNPTMTFKMTKFEAVGKDLGKMTGMLKIRNKEAKPVTLDVALNGTTTDPWGNDRVAFSAHGKINRQEFGVEFDKTGASVGNEIELNLEVSGVSPSAKAKAKK